MIELRLVKEQYQRMSDEELARFAQNESSHLTLESFHLLKQEFESRNIDLTAIESAQVDRELEEAMKLSEFEKVTAAAFVENIWQYAFDEKEKGRTNKEIHDSLLRKNIAPEYAYMLIENIEPRSKELADSFENQIYFGWLLLIAGLIVAILSLNANPISMFIIWAVSLIIGGIIRLSTGYSKKSKYERIFNIIQTEKEEQESLYQ